MKRYELPANGFATKRRERQFWRRVINGQRRSNLTRIEFCNRYGLKLGSFKRWVTQLNRELSKDDGASEQLNFVQIKIDETKDSSATDRFSNADRFEIELSSGDKLRLPLYKDALLMVVNLLKGKEC